jgi:hypothetical protein
MIRQDELTTRLQDERYDRRACKGQTKVNGVIAALLITV